MVIKERKSLKGSSKLTKEMWQDNKREQLLKNFLLLYNIYESIDEFPRRDQLLSLQDAASLSWGVTCLRRSSHVFTTVPPCNLSTFGKQLSTAETWRKRPATLTTSRSPLSSRLGHHSCDGTPGERCCTSDMQSAKVLSGNRGTGKTSPDDVT